MGYVFVSDEKDLAIWSNPTDEHFLENFKDALASKSINPQMAHMGEDYLFYPASKRFVIYYTLANTSRFAKKGNQIF